ncbi:exodeoxyribonuclease VII small subunit [Desulfolucanica intricata]|uniref:exodeoxyribonuclease VII small subunit n=1 Tax=Desulfolucanica intricata TaxID=1285191 RepID=UPI0008332116|nr:exodeoxyribonuclease VII small subunit [Desulfolucanica intricata]
MSFEEALSRLEEVVRKLENGQIPLEQALDLFAEGIRLSKYCAGQLNQAEKKIARLISDAEGQQLLIPMEEAFFEGGQN